jgi:hypothetical protein
MIRDRLLLAFYAVRNHYFSCRDCYFLLLSVQVATCVAIDNNKSRTRGYALTPGDFLKT